MKQIKYVKIKSYWRDKGMEIQTGEYVRTDNGLLGKVNKIEPQGSGLRFAGEFITDEIIQFNDGNFYERRAKSKRITKHSFNIIDLIEERRLREWIFSSCNK